MTEKKIRYFIKQVKKEIRYGKITAQSKGDYELLNHNSRVLRFLRKTAKLKFGK